MTDALIISDLHLSDARPAALALFQRFLREQARAVPRLYILGDLFDAWIGDDDDAPFARTVVNELRALVDSGTGLYLQRGNRDFMVGKRFARETGAIMMSDFELHELGGAPTLLTHGDLLCTDDHKYQKARRLMFNPLFQWFMRRKSLPRRRQIAADYRARSQVHKHNLTDNIMDVNDDAVREVMARHKVQRLIHGHTHRPAAHQVALADGPGERYVLDQWSEERGDSLRVTDNGVMREAVSPGS